MAVISLNDVRASREPRYQEICANNLLDSDALALAAPWKNIAAESSPAEKFQRLLESGALAYRAAVFQRHGNDIDEWQTVYWRGDFKFSGESFLSRRMGELRGYAPVVDIALNSFADLAKEKKPAFHIISGVMGGEVVTYTRLWMPLLDANGEITHVVAQTSERLD
ncbi:MAG: hypothetical protein HOA08_13655 [Rhodospirillaceae bacterium]|jgi:hypothetical protein|nr:hypothetical protein [Rhodospirillaceae bacterium]MBT3493189.1 hypothetical protein [Rhodospirillaceae bacterium]MBT3782092.1 hypothetical protein [Rhodospirillaceae bacterium]MBT3977610.1 hypothetical protein [Rhodospirillaceae bacterium]MBT4166675.1 hypothetical protein [Rhodospirillaceae bacterium]